jgi:hypothetical protein
MEEEGGKEYRWEGGYEKTWEAIQEDKEGLLDYSVQVAASVLMMKYIAYHLILGSCLYRYCSIYLLARKRPRLR